MTSDIPDPLFKIRPVPDLFFKFKIRSDPVTNLTFNLKSGRFRFRILNVLILCSFKTENKFIKVNYDTIN